ncbi:DUF6575 domain-containing protein [Salinarimonas sp.]|uniref:DUF6575 domain-containing protein n=1 Tax=Salinarimonas sp. TaxID=2766526 RepID=UPI0032D94158
MTLPLGTRLGKLQYLEVLVDYDGPQLFTCKNSKGTVFAAVHGPEDENGDNWLFVEISDLRVRKMIDEEVDLHTIFRYPEEGKRLYKIVYQKDNVYVKAVNPIDLPVSYFPVADGKELVLQESAFDIGEVVSRAPRAFESPFTPFWRDDGLVQDLLSSLRTSVSEAARISRRPVFDVTLKPYGDQHRRYVPLQNLSGYLSALQRLFDVLGNETRKATRLNAVAVFPSSFGIRIEADDAGLFGDTGSDKAISLLLRVISATGELDSLRKELFDLSPSQISAFRAYVKSVRRMGTDVAFEVGIPSSSETMRAEASFNSIRVIERMLDRASEEKPELIFFVGNLRAVNLKSKYFLLEDEGVAIAGRISDSLLPGMQGKGVDTRQRGKIQVRRDVNEMSGEEATSYILLGLDDA